MVVYVPLPYVVGDEYGPVPPWLDGLRILERDEALIWKNRPNLRQRYVDVFGPAHTEQDRTALLYRFFPRIPDSLKRNSTWEISLNSEGFRDAEFPGKKLSDAFRIICLGDSWTFGWNVGQEQASPQRLNVLLKQEFPSANFEVFNLGVGGYSSYQGLGLMRRRAIDLDPDVVIIGFAMNDSSVPGYRDKDMARPVALAARISHFPEKFESYKLLRYVALALKDKPGSIGARLKAEADSAQKGEDILERRRFERRDYEKLEPWTRVSLNDYEKNILQMINLARSRAAGVILLYSALWKESPYRMVLERISKAEGLPLLDSSALVAEARRAMEEELERKLDLRPAKEPGVRSKGEIEVVFRVYLGDYLVPKAVSIVGNHPKLGNLVPNKTAMYDDGTHGDQKAADNVWSYSATFPHGTKLFYVYTNSGEQSKWEGLDVPSIRSFKVDANHEGKKLYRPIESFGRLYMQADNWHTNAAGYELIAKTLLEILKKDQKVKDYLRQVNDTRSRSPLS